MNRYAIAGLAVALAVSVGTGCDEDFTDPSFSESAQADFLKVFDVTAQTTFSLTGINGRIELRAYPEVTRVLVSGTRRVESDTKEDAERRLEALIVESESTENDIHFRTKQPQDTEGRNYAIDYVVSLPDDLVLVIGNINGPISIEGSTIHTTIGGVNGSIDFEDIGGTLVALLVNGNIAGITVASPGDSIHAATTNGNIDLQIDKDGSATIAASLTNGTVSVLGLNLSDRAQTTRSLSGRLGSGEGRIEASTVNGNIKLLGR